MGTRARSRRQQWDDAGTACAYHELTRASKFRIRLHQLHEMLRSRGVPYTLRKIAEKLRLLPPEPKPTRPSTREDEVLNLEPGEWVAVKSADEIRATLDDRNMNRGLAFMGEMWKFCGQEFRVLKRMRRLMVDSTGQMREIKNTVLLEGTTCDGAYHGSCDASCHHLWREAWLRRVEAPTGHAPREEEE